MRRRIWTAILLASLGWGTGGVATRAAFDEGVEPFALALYRTVIATVAVVIYLVIRGRGMPRGAVVWKVGAVMGIVNLAAPIVFFNLAYQHASAGFVGLLAALIPLATAVMAHFMLPDEPLTAMRVGGLGVAMAGVAVLLASGDSGLSEGGRPELAFAFGLGAVATIAFAGIYAKRYAGTYEPFEVAMVQFTVGTVVLAAGMGIVEGSPVNQTAAGWGLLAHMGLAATFLPFVLYYWLLRHVSATFASVIGYVVPLVAIVSGVVLLDERLQPGIVLGGALILAGVLITERLEARMPPRPAVVPAEPGEAVAPVDPP